MGSSKKHKEKHHKKEKKRRRSRSRSAERQSPRRSRSRSPIQRKSYENSASYTSASKNVDRNKDEYAYDRIQEEKEYYRGSSATSTAIPRSHGDVAELTTRSRLTDVKIKEEPEWDSSLHTDYRGYSGRGDVLDAHSSVGRIIKKETEISLGDEHRELLGQREADERSRDRDYQDEVERHRRAKLREWKKEQSRKERAERHREAPVPVEGSGPAAGSSGGDISLSIEETNKLRAQLGLKPLDVGSSAGKAEQQEKSYEDRDDVHQPAVNLAEQRKAAKVKERLEEIREKRRIHKKLQKVKTVGLGDEVDEDDDLQSAAAWVHKSRKLEQEKQMAEKRAKMLAEMDDEFGISGIADQMLGRKDKRQYTSKDLRGMRVEHGSSEFKDDAAVVLTLKDKGVLDEDEDVLENVNLVDNRKSKKNVENKKKLPDYRPYDEPDEDGMLRAKEVLEKYDKVIEGDQVKSFRLDSYGRVDDSDDRELERIRENLRSQQVTLQMNEPQLAREYYTSEEMVKFNKPKKKRKIRKREIVKADDLLPMGEQLGPDHGSRNQRKGSKPTRTRDPRLDEYTQEAVNMDISDNEESGNTAADPGNSMADIVNDEAELELQLALERSRKLKLKDKNSASGAEKVAQVVHASQSQNGDAVVAEKKSKGTIVLDSTSEFCRTLGEVPTSASDRASKEEPEDEDMMYVGQEYGVKAGGWSRVYETKSRVKEEPEVNENVLDSEPIAGHGVASALSLATMKGYLEVEKKKEVKKVNLNFPETRAFIDEEKMRDDDRDRHHRYDPYGFKEKEGYKPDIKLEYVDESGRSLTPKEAFRYLSHKFHGKGSGKMKTEKRAKKQGEEARLEQMSAIDTPLGTVKMMTERQKQASTPYVVLSGGGKNLLSSETISKK